MRREGIVRPQPRLHLDEPRSVLPSLAEKRFGLPGGDIFDGGITPDPLRTNRPAMGYAAYRGPISALYHGGAGAHPGGGVTGLPDLNAARQIARDLTFR